VAGKHHEIGVQLAHIERHMRNSVLRAEGDTDAPALAPGGRQ
jgi:hypothetical protein